MPTSTFATHLESVLNQAHVKLSGVVLCLVISFAITPFITSRLVAWYDGKPSQPSRTSWFFSTGDLSSYKVLLEFWNTPPRTPEDDHIDGFGVGRREVEDEPNPLGAVEEVMRQLGVDVEVFWRRFDAMNEEIPFVDDEDYKLAFRRELFDFFDPRLENALLRAFQEIGGEGEEEEEEWIEDMDDDDEDIFWFLGDEELMVGYGVDTLSWTFPSNWRLWPIRERLQFWDRAAPP